MDTMKRGQMGEADKHAIRRKVEERQNMIREQRKVRERLSRECADTLMHIASTKSTIRHMKARHQSALEGEEEEFQYSTAADRREVAQCEAKRAELERVLASSDIIEREQEVLSKRLKALRTDDERQAASNAREMDYLKRNLFNVRNELENAFRTTLHDLNVAYQDQAFDAMVEEATKAKQELPSLRQSLSFKTQDVNTVMAKQGRSLQGEGQAKAERDITKQFVKLQAQREAQLRRGFKARKEQAAREESEMKALGKQLDAIQAEADELRGAAAELRQHKAEVSRERQECLHACMRAHTLASKGPKAIKAELKRKRLGALTAAAAASFKPSRLRDDSRSNPVRSTAALSTNGNTRTDDTQGEKMHRCNETRNRHLHTPDQDAPCVREDGELATLYACRNALSRGGLDMEGAHHRQWKGGVNQGNEDDLCCDSDDNRSVSPSAEDIERVAAAVNETTDKIWRASLASSRIRPGRDVARHSDTLAGSLSVPRAQKAVFRREGRWADGQEECTGSTSVDERGPFDDGCHIDAAELDTLGAQRGRTLVKPRLDRLPAEVLASMLLSDEADGPTVDVLNRARGLGSPAPRSPLLLQPFPDLPYGFTSLGRRLNVGNRHGCRDDSGLRARDG